MTVWKGEWDGMASAKGSYSRVDNDSAIRTRGLQPDLLERPGFLDTDPFRAHCLSNLRKIWILDSTPKRNKAGSVLLDVDEVNFSVQNDLNHGSSSFYLRQQGAHSQHCEASIAA